MEGLVIQLVIMLVLGFVSAAIANSKGRSGVGWFFGGFFLGIIGLIIVAVLPNLKEQKYRQEAAERENRRLREQLMQEQIKSEAFRRHAAARLDMHDNRLGVDTRSIVGELPAPEQPPALDNFNVAELPHVTPVNGDEAFRVTPDNTFAGVSVPGNAQAPAADDAMQAWVHGGVHPHNGQQAAPAMQAGNREWFYEADGETVGPIDDQRLVDLARSGKIVTTTLLWTEQLQEWKPAGVVKALQPHLQS